MSKQLVNREFIFDFNLDRVLAALFTKCQTYVVMRRSVKQNPKLRIAIFAFGSGVII